MTVSEATRHLNTTDCPAADAGRLTVTGTNPPEVPVQAGRPAIGLPSTADIAPL